MPGCAWMCGRRPAINFRISLLPTLALIPLMLSAVGSYWASEAAKKDDRRGMILGLLLNLVLAGIFFVMRLYEWHSLNFNWQADQQGTYVWTILGLHSFDFVAGMLETLVLLVFIVERPVRREAAAWAFMSTALSGISWWPSGFRFTWPVYWGPQIPGGAQ